MPVELRKRKAPTEPAPLPPAKKKSKPVKTAVSKAKAAVMGKKDPSTNGTSSTTSNPTVGSTITPDGFGGEVETNDGKKTTFKKILDASTGGIVLFTYPKASTPGCTTQVCMFRDEYTPLTATGFSIYGLSRDSPKANTTFKTKQKLPYPLLCDISGTLISAIGLKKAPSGTTRGVFVVNKAGKVLAAEAGGPGATVGVVKWLLQTENGSNQEPSAPEPAAAASAEPTNMEGVETAAAPEADSEPAKETNKDLTTESVVAEASAESVAQSVAEPIKETVPTPEVIANGQSIKEDDANKAAVAADVADSAAKLDPATPNPA